VTPTELKTAALVRLQVLPAGENPDPDDFTLIGQKYAGLHAQLLAPPKQLAIWALNEDIPAKCQEPMVAILAAFAAHDFSVSAQRRRELIAEGGLDLPQPSIAERQLRKALASPYVTTTFRGTYY
jgi:hypothetical protein